MTTEYAKRDWIDHVLALVIAFGAFILYRITLSAGAFPGSSAELIVRCTGLAPKLTADNPLWWGCARMLAGNGAGLALRLNTLSAVLGALCVGLLYQVMSSALYHIIDVDDTNHIRVTVAVRLAGLCSAAFLMFCIPFWIVSTRASTLPLGILILLTATWILVLYIQTSRLWLALLFAFVYGIGIVEFATLIPFAMLFGPILLLTLWRNEALRPLSVLGLVAATLCGLSLYAIAAWAFSGSEGYVLRDYSTPFQVVWIMWRDQILTLTRSLPQRGWLIVLILTVIPWLAALFVARRALNEEKDWAFYLLHLVMSVVVVLVALNFKNISPWRMLGFGRLLVTPYLLVASLFGYLAAYWFLLPSCWWTDDVDEPAGRRWTRKWFGTFLAVPALVLVVLFPFRNHSEADGRSAGFINACAAETVKSLDGRSWIVTAGIMDNHFRIAAREGGIPLNILNLSGDADSLYMQQLATRLEEPTLKNLTKIGTSTLIQEWLSDYPDAMDKIALFLQPDLWVGAGQQVIPHKALFMGAPALDKVQVLAAFDENRIFWERAVSDWLPALPQTGHISHYNNYMRQRLSLAANNYGVMMEDLDEPDKAFFAYRQARLLNTNNVSALLNMRTMDLRGHKSEIADEVEAAWQTLISTSGSRFRLWSLSRNYGYVRSPQAFIDTGFSWALSGRPGMAVAGIKKAMDMLPDEETDPLKATLGMIYLKQDEPEKGKEILSELLTRDPKNKAALMGLANLAARKGDFAEAKALLTRGLKAGVPKTTIALEWARANILARRDDQARVLLENLIEQQPDLAPAHILLADLFLHKNDSVALQKSLERMQRIPRCADFVAFVKGQLALKENDMDKARDCFETALAIRPRSILLLEMLLRMDVVQRKQELANRHAITLLRLAPDNPLGNHIMGSFHMTNTEYEQAETFFRKSLKAKRTYEVLNDLAWVLQELEQYEEGEKLSREAAEMRPTLPHVSDTLGVILMKTGRLEEALVQMERYRAAIPQDPEGALHLAQLYARMKKTAQVHALLEEISPKSNLLSADNQETLARLKRDVQF